jgi:UDP-N-acetylglucosamine 2-epimerase (non-hydrolysing)
VKVLCVWGTRPEAIKLSPVVAALAKSGFSVSTCVTAQHRELLDIAGRSFKLKPDRDLRLMRRGQTLADLTARIVQALPAVLDSEKPELVLVQGDSTTAFAAALSAFYCGLPVGHVEAGLRTFDRSRPFPEELNRRMVDELSTLHFAPTPLSARNLRREGVTDSVYVTGNTVVDALQAMLPRLRAPRDASIRSLFKERRVLLATAHRRESFGRPLKSICGALTDLLEAHPDAAVLIPVHPNPAVRSTMKRLRHPRVKLVEPMPYEELLWCMREAALVLTDSGGIQEEAPSLGAAVCVLRDVTDRPEAVSAGSAVLAGVDRRRIFKLADGLLRDPKRLARMKHAGNPFGDGRAGERIAQAILHFFGKGRRPKGFTP